MMTVRELVTKIGFNVNDAPLLRAQRAVTAFKSAAIGLGLEVGAVAGSLFALVKSSASTAHEIELTAQRIGLSTTAFQEFAFGAKKAGIEQEKLVPMLGILAVHLDKAKTKGKDALKLFTDIGFTKHQIDSVHSMDQLIPMLADKIKGINDPLKLLAVSRELMGRQGASAIPWMKQGSAAMREQAQEALRLGAVLDEHTIKAGVEFQKRWLVLTDLIDKFKTKVGAGLLPQLNKLIDTFLTWLSSSRNQKAIQDALRDAVTGLSEAFKVAWTVGKSVVGVFQKLSHAVGGTKNAIEVLLASFAGFKILGLIAAIAGPEIAGIIALIGGIALAVYLIYDDVKAFLEGRPSLFAPIYQKMVPVIEAIKEKWKAFTQFIGDFWTVAMHDVVLPFVGIFKDSQVSAIEAVIKGIMKLVGWIETLTEKIKSIPYIGTIMSAFQFMSGTGGLGEALKMAGGLNSKFAENLHERAQEIRGAPYGGQALKVSPWAAMRGGLASQSNKFDINQKIEINVESGADAQDIGEAARKATREENGKMLRNAKIHLESF